MGRSMACLRLVAVGEGEELRNTSNGLRCQFIKSGLVFCQIQLWSTMAPSLELELSCTLGHNGQSLVLRQAITTEVSHHVLSRRCFC